ncbi:MAG TPA: peptide chain release factor N(5)-glutamine methyltransferase [Sphingobacteriaceae bacterium]|nr:peptide chain release factor N(5)-glutamine methyltransferase [Sphingobacteriaceae bacterium]
MTIAEAEKTFIIQLKSIYDTEEAKGMAFQVIHHLTGISKSHFLLNKNETIPEENILSIIRIMEELKTGKPLQYVLGETEFYGLKFKVNSSVLIPRPETEELVDWVLKEITKSQIPNPKSQIILDIGTGSGCIAISLKKHLPQSKVYALDKFQAALEIAGHNAVLNQTKISFIQADLLKEPELIPNLNYSIIISNPPYITDKEKQQMHTNVLEHEPHSALFVADNSPLIFYERIAVFAKTHLTENGLLFFEINERFGKETVSLLEKEGFNNIELKKDLQGKHRMIKAQIKR